VKKFNWLGIVIITILVITFALSSKVLLPATIKPAEAFGQPGACPTWSPSTLTFLGTASNPTSKVWFTGFNGILGEVFYPSVDKPATVDWQFLVGDARHTWVDEEKNDTTSQVTLNDARSLAWTITNTSKNGLYQIQKTIFTDPNRNSPNPTGNLHCLRGNALELQPLHPVSSCH
jgi:glucoamylase